MRLRLLVVITPNRRYSTHADIGLVYPASSVSSSFDTLHGHTDSGFAGDRADRKPQGGFLFQAYGGPIDWQPEKQLLVATSTTEAEYVDSLF